MSWIYLWEPRGVNFQTPVRQNNDPTHIILNLKGKAVLLTLNEGAKGTEALSNKEGLLHHFLSDKISVSYFLLFIVTSDTFHA